VLELGPVGVASNKHPKVFASVPSVPTWKLVETATHGFASAEDASNPAVEIVKVGVFVVTVSPSPGEKPTIPYDATACGPRLRHTCISAHFRREDTSISSRN
jgi:hypothetical protein